MESTQISENSSKCPQTSRIWLLLVQKRSEKDGESESEVGMARFRPQRAQMMPLGIGYCGLPMLIFLPTETLGPRPQGS